MLCRLLTLFILVIALNGCGSFERSSKAAAAKHQMVGMPKEEVLACMGPPQKRAQVGITEVWSYNSSNGLSTSENMSHYDKAPGYSLGGGAHERYFCTVNIVMKNDIVTVVHYNGPRGGSLSPDEQCGFAIEHCVE